MAFASIQGIVKWMQGVLRHRQSHDRNDQHLKQDIGSYIEDLQDTLEV
jgi:hypothetical protein